MRRLLDGPFRSSALILAQRFVYTPFDWRIGVLNGEAVFACRYHMSRNHWQVIKHEAAGHIREGNADTLPIVEVPTRVLGTAVRAARLIGNGIYGVDIKDTGEHALVMEVNDNPNIDAGVEDRVLGMRLYERIIESFLTRVERLRGS